MQRFVSASSAVEPTTERPLKPTKWGRCPECQYSLAPHLFQSGPHAGNVRLLCSQFWRYHEGKRLCFRSVALDAADWTKLPRWLRQKHAELPASLRRNSNTT